MNTFQWNHSTTVANHSCPGHSDVWHFYSNDFIFVMSTCRSFIRPGRGQGPLLSMSGLRRAASQRPVAKQHGGMLSPHAQNLRGNWLARQIECCDRHRQQIYSFAKTDLLNKKATIEHWHTNWQKGSFFHDLIIHRYGHQLINTLWPCDAIWQHITGSISSHLMAFCLTA